MATESYQLRVAEVIEETADARSVVFEVPSELQETFAYTPGQFLTLAVPSDRRMWDLFRALGRGWPIEQIHEATKIDLWFLRQFAEIRDMQRSIAETGLEGLDADRMRRLKRAGFGDAEIGLAAGQGVGAEFLALWTTRRRASAGR